MRVWTMALLTLVLGCGRRGEAPPTAAACVPGAAAVCACRGGPSGVQTCQRDGTYGTCACETPVAIARRDDPDKPPPVVPFPAAPSAPVAAPMAPPTPVVRPPPPARPRPAVDPSDNCISATNCQECAARVPCGWCGATRRCVILRSNSVLGPEARACQGSWALQPQDCGRSCGGRGQLACPGYHCNNNSLAVGLFCP